MWEGEKSMNRGPTPGQHLSLKKIHPTGTSAHFVFLIQKHKEIVVVSSLLVAKLYANIEKHFPMPFYTINVNMFTAENLETRKNKNITDNPIT